MTVYIEAMKWLWNEESSFWLDRVMVVVAAPLFFIGFIFCEVLPKLWGR